MQLDNPQTMSEILKSTHGQGQSQTQGHSPSQEIRFRCPCCEKLYQTQSDVFSETDPEFDCENCQKSFILLTSVNAFGLFETKSDQYNFSSCPKCNHLMPAASKECPSCGVFVEKYEQMAQAESPALYELNQLWAKVINQFSDDHVHQNFLTQCQQKTALSFAFQKYDELRKTMNYDMVCEKYLKQIELRLEQQLLAKHAPASKDPSRARFKMQLTQWIFAVIGFVGLSLLIFNKIRPTFPNLTGLVVSITVLSFGLWLLSSQNSNKNIKL